MLKILAVFPIRPNMILGRITIGVVLSGLFACAPSSFEGGGGVKPAKKQTQNNLGLPSSSPLPDGGGETPMQPGGVVFTKLGINLEDLGYSGDKDFNDTVYCFTFKGTLVGTSIQSSEQQTIQITRTNNSKQSHNMEVRVLDANKTPKKSHSDFSSNKTSTQFSIEVEKGDYIDAVWKLASGAERLIDNPEFFRVLPNQCNR
jgi:hypothetical protein